MSRPAGDGPTAATVVGVIVTFHPDPQLPERLRALVGQVGAILIVDNGSSEEELAPLERMLASGDATLLRNETNLGLATAFNHGARWAAEREYRWFLLLDQDSVPGPAIVAEAARVFAALPTPVPAVIGASWTDHRCDDDPGRVARAVISSGALHDIDAWTAIGPFRDDFFIDYIDIEYCLRARRHGYAVLRACAPTMEHAIGQPREVKTRLRSFTPSHHSPARRYTMTRNRLRVWRAYWRGEAGYVARDMSAAARETVKIVLFESRRRAKLQAMLRGIADAVRGRSGPAPRSIR